MASFFKQIIDLGEEKPVELSDRVTEDLTKLSQEELVRELHKALSKIEEKENERKQIQQDGLALQSKFEAYKKKVDAWQVQMKESRAADKKMIDELRAASLTGKVDEAFQKATNETIANLKQSLREAQDDAARAYRRQRGAEEARAAYETTSKREFSDLCERFDSFKEKSKLTQERYEDQINVLRRENVSSSSSPVSSELTKLRTQVEFLERQCSTLQARGTSLEKTEGETVVENDNTTKSNEDYSSVMQSEAANTQLQSEVTLLRNQLSAAQVREQDITAKLRHAEERVQRLLEDAEWESIETHKKFSEFKTQADSWKAKCSQIEAKIELKEEELRAMERQNKRAVRDLEDTLATEKEQYSALVRKAEEMEQFLAEQLQQEKEKVAKHDTLVDEANQVSQRTSDTLESQRMHFEVQLAQREVRIQELYSLRDAQEVALMESKADVRRLEDQVEDLRRQIIKNEDVIRELELQQVEAQKLLTIRENDLQSREKERQSTRTRLKDEEERNIELHEALREIEMRLSEVEQEVCRKETARANLSTENNRLVEENERLRNTSASMTKLLQSKETQLTDLSRKLQDQGIRNMDIVRLREDQSAVVRGYERRIMDLEKSLAAASTGGSPLGVVDVQTEKRKQFLNEAYAAVRRPHFLKQRTIIALGVLCLMILCIFFVGFRFLPSMSDTDTLSLLKEKYGQSLAQVTACQEMLVRARTAFTNSQIKGQFAACRQPWNEYINMLTKEDSSPYAAQLFDKPAYRGRKVGKEGWIFNQQSQLHFHMYPDERVFANLQRWRQGDTVGDIAIQQFRSAQPFNIDNDDEQNLKFPDAETYMKLNYKNAAVFSRLLTRAGTFYPIDILPMNPEALVKLRRARGDAIELGLYPRQGNPYWHRSQKFRPKPNRDTYDPLSTRTKNVMEQFAFNWLQTDRIRRYFEDVNNQVALRANQNIKSATQKNPKLASNPYDISDIGYSTKNPTVPGLMSVSGMKKKTFNLYSRSSKKRMGFGNPLLGIRKI